MLQSMKEQAKVNALKLVKKVNIVLTDKEVRNMEVADFSLDEFDRTGVVIVTYVNTNLCCAKEMFMQPGQTVPEHTHKPLPNGFPGKEEPSVAGMVRFIFT